MARVGLAPAAVFLIVLLGSLASESSASSVREDEGNCIGVKSCRPRCITFRLDRSEQECDSSEGIFTIESRLNPWDTKRFRMLNCEPSGTCINEKCGNDLSGDLIVRIGEEGYSGSTSYTDVKVPEGQEQFTFCSMYPCPKDECAVPEQMGFDLQLAVFSDTAQMNTIIDSLLIMELSMKSNFVGPPIQKDADNRFGPLHVDWMDDPVGCREGFFSPYAPVAPLQDPVVKGDYSELGPSLYCTGEAYELAPLPQTAPPSSAPSIAPSSPKTPPTSAPSISSSSPTNPPTSAPTGIPSSFPSSSPTTSFQPTSAPTGISSSSPTTPPTSAPTSVSSSSPTTSFQPTSTQTLSPDTLSQIEGLLDFYDSTGMEESEHHNWFTNMDYCNFTGVQCDSMGYIVGIVLVNKGLTGSLPPSLESLSHLQELKLTGNSITGAIPSAFSSLQPLTVVELGANQLTGTIPSEIGGLQFLHRLMVQNNKLRGTIPSSLCNVSELFAFDVSGNVDMHGEIPQCFGALSDLDVLRMDGVGLVGEVPAELCSIRPFNGLTPNYFGCNAIACPAGYYEPLTGRETSLSTECLPCLTPSNVIGSTKCMFVDGNKVLTPIPTTSAFPSAAPSSEPSSTENTVPTFLPTASAQPSSYDSASPSAAPSLPTSTGSSITPTTTWSTNPSKAPIATNRPTISSTAPPTSPPSVLATPTDAKATLAPIDSTTKTANITLLFKHVSTKITDQLELATFERITLDYVEENLAEGTIVDKVNVLSQSLQEQPPSNTSTVSLSHERRQLLETTALFVQIELIGETVGDSFDDAVLESLEGNFGSYVFMLSEDLDRFILPANTRIGDVDGNEKVNKIDDNVSDDNDNLNWGLLVSALALSVVAIGMVLFVRHQRHEYALELQAQQSDQREDGIPAFPNQDDIPVEPLSDESDSGWNSASDCSEEDEGGFVNPVNQGALDDSVAPWTVLSSNNVDGDGDGETSDEPSDDSTDESEEGII